MVDTNIIKQQIPNTLKETNFKLGKLYKGKVRDNYTSEDGKQMIIITSDRISCFDVVVGTIPFKGQLLNQTTAFWFDNTKDIVDNHILDIPDPNVMVVKKCKPLPVEMIVRGYITGSLWREYEKGTRKLYGLTFEDNMKKNQKFPEPIITPSTKAELGEHDEPISKEELISKGLVDKEIYEQLEKISLELFKKGTELTAKNSLILVDTKYEFGLWDGNIVLIDEIHTPDSSRFWYIDGYKDAFKNNKDPKLLDKEYLRQWLISKGYMGDGDAPEFPEDIKIEACKRYIEAFERITGQDFKPEQGDVLERVTANLKDKGYMN